MSLVAMVVVLIAVGIGLWLLNNKTKLEPWVKTLINIIVVIAVVLYILNATGVWQEVKAVPVPRL